MKSVYKFVIIPILAVLISVGSCKKMEDLLVNPNNPSPSTADVNLYLNAVQLSFANVFNDANGWGMGLTRMQIFFGPTYASGISPNSMDGLWTDAYSGLIKQTDAMIPVAKGQGKYVHAAIGEILKAYTLFTLVDMLGDVPNTQADLGVENTNPGLDKGADVYAAGIKLLDTAIADLAKTPSSYPTTDLFMTSSGSSTVAKWRKVAKTLKFRAYMNTRLVDNTAKSKIEALIADGDLITTDANEWTFLYGKRQSTPNNRHPRYNDNYVASGGAGDYIGTYFLYSVVAEKPVADPRRRYYFYRQSLVTPGNIQQQPCAYQNAPPHYVNSNSPYCYFITAAGYWGRDHGDASGIPPDGTLRTTWGAYPAGGRYDNSEGEPTSLTMGGQGSGIHPLWMSFFTDFERAEAALALGVTGDPRALLESGIRKSITRVMAFPTEIGVSPVPSVGLPTTTTITNYVNYVLSQYDAAANNDERLDVVLKEYYIALWGNGLDAYNMYRRTCRPKNIQPALQANPGPFIRTMLYPSVYVNLNSTATQKPNVTVKTFWDTNGNCTY